MSLNTGEMLQAPHLATEYAVSRMLTEGGECAATLRRVLAIMGQKLGFAYCVCWRLTENAGCMRVAANWQRHPERTERVASAAQGIEIRPGHGFAGRAWQAASPLWIDDLGSDSDFLRADEAREAGLAAAVCCPIFARSQVIGLLQLIASAGAPPEADSLPVLVSLAAQIGQFLDRDAISTALAASELRYRALFEENIAGVHLSTLEGKALAANPAFVRLLGYESEQEALEADSRELYVNINDRVALMEELRQSGRDLNRQIQLRRNDGATVWVLANTVLIRGGEGDRDLNETTLIDITENKEMERRAWQTTKLEGIGRLAGGIAHDFNNLLTVINGYSDMLLAKLDETDPSQA
ncbi:MAG: PAS domain S-box protein, partial [Terriglobales bacterium]